ncbi:MAG: NADH-quinone oxidoreductase subunit M [Nitrospira sp.]|nr:NADH-quinone oxidoreductase subunit M [Nitrospira sp.]
MGLWLLILIPLLAAPVAWMGQQWSRHAPRWIALSALSVDVLLALFLSNQGHSVQASDHGAWLVETQTDWIPHWGITLHLGLDGLSLILILLTAFIGVIAIIASWTEIRSRVGLFHCNVLLALGGVIGVFLAIDLFLFFFFWELMLIPMYLLIVIWGHAQRRHASFKFFLFTQAGSLVLLVAIIALALLHQQATGRLSFDYADLMGLTLSSEMARWLMLAFLFGFLVKLPALPFHTWLPDTYTEAPTGATIILAGILAKTGAYGLLRFTVPMFPEVISAVAPFVMGLGALSILYGAVLACAQSDIKRLVAYSSISHMGFILLGAFAGTELALQGAVMQMVAHGLSTGGLFLLAGALEERYQTRDMGQMGGLWSVTPRLAPMALFFACASLGLPGLANFIGEFLVLFGSYAAQPIMIILASLGMVLAAIYSLGMMQRTFFGRQQDPRSVPDLSNVAFGTVLFIAVLQIWLGLYPRVVLSTAQPVMEQLVQAAVASAHPTQSRAKSLLSSHIITSQGNIP